MNSTLSKRIGLVFSALCGAGLFVCLLCDFWIAGRITWAAYPALAIPFGWLVVMAFLLSKKHRILGSLTALTLLTLPFLFGLDLVTPGRAWFVPVALPIGAASIISAWLSLAAFKLLRFRWALLAVYMFQYVVLLSGFVDLIVSRYTGAPFWQLDLIINLLSGTALTCLFTWLDMKKPRPAKEERAS